MLLSFLAKLAGIDLTALGNIFDLFKKVDPDSASYVDIFKNSYTDSETFFRDLNRETLQKHGIHDPLRQNKILTIAHTWAQYRQIERISPITYLP